MRTFVFGVLIALTVIIAAHVGVGIGRAAASDTVRVRVPVCAEDEPYLRGRGDFDGASWSRYVCVHVDAVNR